jgi:hypothetical protein
MDGTPHDMLGRIAVLLLALAALAERAGSRAVPVRCLVLSILRDAEAAASTFVVEVAPRLSVECSADRPCDGLDDAALLADRLRALAAVFFALSCQAPRGARRLIVRRPGPATRACPAIRGPRRAAHRSRAPPAAS